MKNVSLNIKPVRGKKLPLKAKTTINDDDLEKRAIEKHSQHDQSFCSLEEYVSLYPLDFNLTPIYIKLKSLFKAYIKNE